MTDHKSDYVIGGTKEEYQKALEEFEQLVNHPGASW
jgi:hypothetical protein